MIKDKKSPVTNNVFKTIVRDVVREELTPMYQKLSGVEKRFDVLTETRLNRLETGLNRLEDRMVAFEEQINTVLQKFRSDIFDLIDPLVGEIKTHREEQTINAGQHQRFDNRLETLEKIHPQGKHVVL